VTAAVTGRARLKGVLRHAGLLDIAREARDVVSSRRWLRDNLQFWRNGAPDGLPIPPLRLVRASTGTSSLRWMFDGGALAAASVADILAQDGCRIESVGSLLDFGCGCGRVVRRWARGRAEIHGCDYHAASIAWCRRHLTHARFEVNGLAPPLPYAGASFDVVYALSVFTHLPEPLCGAWFEELRRVLRPGGRLVISTHGEAYLGELDAQQQARFQAGDAVVRHSDAAGTNLCGVYFTVDYLRARVSPAFEVVASIPRGARGNPPQDLVLLRRQR
jgi:SAM-dependent methyltransferase